MKLNRIITATLLSYSFSTTVYASESSEFHLGVYATNVEGLNDCDMRPYFNYQDPPKEDIVFRGSLEKGGDPEILHMYTCTVKVPNSTFESCYMTGQREGYKEPIITSMCRVTKVIDKDNWTFWARVATPEKSHYPLPRFGCYFTCTHKGKLKQN